MQISVLPLREDNYAYMLHDARTAAVIDPGDDAPVLRFLRAHTLRLTTVLLTHAHGDHIAGAAPLRAATGATVLGPAGAGIPGLDRELRERDAVPVPGDTLTALATPGHLPVHLAYFSAAQNALFSGDALFGGGCGRIMGSTATTLWQSLCRLRDLPPETRVYCGHEYTVSNLEFAAHLEPGNAAVARRLAEARALRTRGLPTIPSTLALERLTNPFLRTDDPAFLAHLGLHAAAPADVFADLRRRKDRW